MTTSEEELIKILRHQLCGDALPPIKGGPALLKLAKHHAVLGMVALLPPEVMPTMPRRVRLRLIGYAQSLREKHKRNNEFLQLMHKRMQQDNVRHAILKGQECAVCYPEPEYRAIGDIDLYVIPQHFDRAVAILQETGCLSIEETMLHVTMRHPEGWDIEVHRQLQKLQWPSHNRLMTPQLKEDRLPLDLHLLTLTVHTLSHIFCAGIGLRHVCDWMMMREKCGNCLPTLEMYEQTGTVEMHNTLVYICNTYFGKNYSYLGTPHERLYQRVFNWMLQSGNFGHGEHLSTFAYYRRFLWLCIRFHALSPKEAWAWPVMKIWRALKGKAHHKLDSDNA